MSKNLRGKINNLENHILQPFKVGSTQFCPWALPKAEQRLFDKALQLILMEIPFDELTVEQRTILDQAHNRLRARIFDLFTSYMTGLLCRGDKSAQITVHERFLWFIRELAKEVEQELEVAEIEKNMKDDDPIDKVDEYYRNAPETFTKDSYYELLDEIFRETVLPHILKDGKKGVKREVPQQ